MRRRARRRNAPGHLEKHLKEPLDSSSIRSDLAHPTLLSVETQDDALARRNALDEVKVLPVEFVLCWTDRRSCRSSPLLLLDGRSLLLVSGGAGGSRRKGERAGRAEGGRQQVKEKVEDVLDLVRVVRCIRSVKLEKVGNAASCKGLDSLIFVDEDVTFDEFVLD